MTTRPNSILYRSKVEYTTEPGVYAMNHAVGCAHGCSYCYAYKMAHRFGNAEAVDHESWIHPKLVSDWRERLEADLDRRRREPIRRVFMSFMTDPFPYNPHDDPDLAAINEASLEAIRLLNARDIPVTTLTKGSYPIDELQDLHPDNEYGVTLMGTAAGIMARLEPAAAPASARLGSIIHLASSDCKTWVSIEPFGFVFPTDDHPFAGLDRLLWMLTFTDRVVFGRANYCADAYKGDEWYARCARLVREWGEEHGIEVIIKKGTPTGEEVER